MSNGGWAGHFGGDLDIAKQLQSEYQNGPGHRRGRGARGARGSSNMTHSGSSFANTSAFTNNVNVRGNLATAPPSHFWEPASKGGTQNTQATNAEPNVSEDCGDPMNIDDRGMDSSHWASESRVATGHAPAPATHTGTGSPLTPASWATTAQLVLAPSGPTPPWGSTNSSWAGVASRVPSNPMGIASSEAPHATNSARSRAASLSRGLGKSIHAVSDETSNFNANGEAASRSTTREQVTWGPHDTPVSSIQPFNSPACDPAADQQVKNVKDSKIFIKGVTGAGPGTASVTKADCHWPGLKASRHAGSASAAAVSRGVPRSGLLQDNGQLVGVHFFVDQGPEQDNNWIKTYNLNQVKEKCLSVAKQASAAGNCEAETALRKVLTACDEVLRTKNDLKGNGEAEADRVLSKAQHEAWVHWIKFYRPAPTASYPGPSQAPDQSRNIHMQDAPSIGREQVEQAQAPRVPAYIPLHSQPQVSPATVVPSGTAQAPGASQSLKISGSDSGGFDPISYQQQSARSAQYSGFEYSPPGGFGSSNSQQFHKSAAQQARVVPQQSTHSAQLGGYTSSGGFGSANAQQTKAIVQQPQPSQQRQGTQQSAELTGLPSMFPQGLPADFDDPQARKIFEDFFFQNKRLN